ncbi:MAG TPA: hypothetical protein VE890_05135 [Thermoguttaceae bacterium]|nr:hypothetical protein [Thermoguttaceae bacterium]
MSQGSDEFRPKSKRYLNGGLIVSLLVHVAVVIALVIYRPWQQEKPAVDSAQPGAAASPDMTDAAAAKNPLELRAQPIPSSTADQVAAKLAESIEQSEQLTEEDNLDELDEQIRRLKQVASEESINQLSDRFQGWLKTRPRATAPAETPAGTTIEGHLDSATAQLLDVKRTRLEGGAWTYQAVLIDARGRTMEAPMEPADGERAFRTLQLLKASPLAESLYRQITLPLLDKMLFDPTRNDTIYSETDRE